jgi:hypothetical protein
MADTWMREAPTGLADEVRWRRTVLTQKLRCFERLGRTSDAMEIKRQLGAP